MKVEVQEKLAMKIDLFNKLMDEQRYAEAGVVAKQAAELDPNNPVVVQVLWQDKFVSRYQWNKDVWDRKEQAVVDTLGEVRNRGDPVCGDKNPMVFPNDGKDWAAFTKRRSKYGGDRKRQRSEREIEIREEAPHAGLAAIRQCPAEQGHGAIWPSWRRSTCISIRRAWPRKA